MSSGAGATCTKEIHLQAIFLSMNDLLPDDPLHYRYIDYDWLREISYIPKEIHRLLLAKAERYADEKAVLHTLWWFSNHVLMLITSSLSVKAKIYLASVYLSKWGYYPGLQAINHCLRIMS